MRRVKQKADPILIPNELYRIKAKFAPDVFLPSNAIDNSFWKRTSNNKNYRFITTDGHTCRVEFICTSNNSDGEYDDYFDDFCQRKFGIPYIAIRSMWIGRLDRVDSYWHWIKLEIEE